MLTFTYLIINSKTKCINHHSYFHSSLGRRPKYHLSNITIFLKKNMRSFPKGCTIMNFYYNYEHYYLSMYYSTFKMSFLTPCLIQMWNYKKLAMFQQTANSCDRFHTTNKILFYAYAQNLVNKTLEMLI